MRKRTARPGARVLLLVGVAVLHLGRLATLPPIPARPPYDRCIFMCAHRRTASADFAYFVRKRSLAPKVDPGGIDTGRAGLEPCIPSRPQQHEIRRTVPSQNLAPLPHRRRVGPAPDVR